MNLTEDYCSFELSKLLKEKGFNEDCNAYYEDGKFCWVWNDGCSRNTDNPKYVSCPSQALAMKWLREKYNIYADAIQQGNYNDNSMYYSYIVAQIIDGRSYIQRNMSVADKFTCKEAVEAALKYVLEKLI